MEGSLTYRTITERGEGFYKEKGSKFLGFAFHVNDEQEVKNRLDELRRKYFDARHHCFAFRIGIQRPIIRANDDGEPNHSAGDPILGQIRALEMTNVLVVVVRYFGGTKLGVGGLIQAYRSAAEDALEGLATEEVFLKSHFEIKYGYEQTPLIERFMQKVELFDINRKFEKHCFLAASVRATERARIDHLAIDMRLEVKWSDQSG
jgi:uncharacterized YigZ family protein